MLNQVKSILPPLHIYYLLGNSYAPAFASILNLIRALKFACIAYTYGIHTYEYASYVLQHTTKS